MKRRPKDHLKLHDRSSVRNDEVVAQVEQSYNIIAMLPSGMSICIGRLATSCNQRDSEYETLTLSSCHGLT